MVMHEPDLDEIEIQDVEDIGIFEPGVYYEREVNWNVIVKVFVYIGLAYVIMLVVTMIIMLPMIAAGLIRIDYTGQIIYEPWSLLILTFGEIGFFTPFLYVKRRGLKLQAIGLKKRINIPKEVILGLGVGALMILSNLAISWVMTGGQGYEEGINPFASADLLELAVWVIVMFVVVGFSEELIFRGFMQRRLETYMRCQTKHYAIAALVITSVIFSALHLDALGFPARFVLGLFLGYLAQKRNYSVLGPSVAHGLNNSVVVILAFFGF